MMKKLVALLVAVSLIGSVFAGCASQPSNDSNYGQDGNNQTGQNNADNQANTAPITVISRETGSGTRGAFIELFGIEEKDANGNKTDHTTPEAMVANKTDVMLTQVAGNDIAIGYVSLGSLHDSVKALKIDGVEATAENVKNGTYQVARPFNIATKGEAAGLAKDFIDFILSAEGQKIVSDSYIPVDESAAAYAGDKPSGKIVVAGSSSVTPVMEKLQEAYVALNPNATIEIQQTDSSAGIQSVIDGNCDIGMASRELKDSEASEVTGIQIAIDGIAVIVNSDNSVSGMTSEMVKEIYTGNVTTWDQASK